MMRNDNFRNDIQGLRAIAVLAVIIFHVNKAWLPGGFIGVDIFFVISGYLMTVIILSQKKSQSFSFIRFYLNRIKRIVPVYLVVLTATTVLMAIFLTTRDFAFFKQSLVAATFFFSNIYFADFGEYFGPSVNELPLLHTWSLAIEMQFYLLLPVFLLVMPKKLVRASMVLIVFVLMAYVTYTLTARSYFSLIARIPEFLVGGLAGLTIRENPVYLTKIKKSNWLAIFALLLIFCSLFFINAENDFPGVLALPACIGTLIIIVQGQSKINTLLAIKPLVFVGTISYSLYLWHWPILAGIRYYIQEYQLSLIFVLLAIFCTFLLAVFSYVLVEKNIQKTQKSIRFFVQMATIAVLSLATVIACLSINKRIVAPLPKSMQQYAVPDEVCHAKIVGDCIQGDRESDQEFLIIGDSHAGQLNIFADVVGKINQQKFKVITATSCVNIPGFDYERLHEWAHAQCLQQIQEVQNVIAKFDTVIIAGIWFYQTESTDFLNALEDFLVSMKKANKKIFILAQPPLLDAHVIRSVRFNDLGLPRKVRIKNEWDKGNKIVKAIAEKYGHVDFLDFSEEPLFANVPFYENELIYSDAVHLNVIGAKKYAESVAANLKYVLN